MDSDKVRKISEALEEHIEMLTRKRGGMSPQEVELLCKALCALEVTKRLGEDDGEYSYRRGRAANGRFASRDGGSHDGYHDDGGNSNRYYDGGGGNSGYSGHSKKDRLIDHLEQLMDAAQNEPERQFLRNWLARIENS